MEPTGGAADRSAQPAVDAHPTAGPAGDRLLVSRRLKSLVEGDRDAKEWAYETFAPKLFRRLRARYSGGERGLDAEELLHDAFLALFEQGRALGAFLEQTPEEELTGDRFHQFLWNQACGIASNRRRSQLRRPTASLPDAEMASPDPDPERESLGRDAVARLDECLEKRGRRTYLYYKLRFSDGLTPEEIEHVTGWSRKATYKLKLALNEAVARCAALLGMA